jgi:hypothetical protein
MTYVRFALDHQHALATALNAGPWEAAHSSANGEWVLGHIEPFKDAHRLGELPGFQLRLMGYPFNTLVVYDIADSAVDMEEGHAENIRDARVEILETE